MNKKFAANEYAMTLQASYGFEGDCVRARHRCNLRNLKQIACQRVLEIGCGPDLLYDRAMEEGVPFDQWTVIEPADEFVELCRSRAQGDRRMKVIQGLMEEVPVGLNAEADYDVVILSGVLHYVNDPVAFVRHAAAFVRPGGHVLVTCPNAKSFHRLLAVQMGLIQSVYVSGERGQALQEMVVFDQESLATVLIQAGLENLRFEGYMFKPFTHGQMEKVLSILPGNASLGLEELGRMFPDQAAEIGFVAERPARLS